MAMLNSMSEIQISKNKLEIKVPVLYYLSRNGQLQHPHFMEVPLSSPQGLFLSDVINRLNALRGKGMASLYSWSCKRSYKNGFVWHDLSENDYIYPAHGQEYILKGSEILETSTLPQAPPENQITGVNDLHRRRRNQSCNSIDFNNLDEYSVYKTDSCAATSAAAALNASTQTDEHRRRRRPPPAIVEEDKRDEIEISPPPSESSPETLMKATLPANEDPIQYSDESITIKKGISKSSSVLMQMISCGSSISFKDCGAGQGMGLIGQYKTRVTRGTGSVDSGRDEKEYFSGSLAETTKKLEELVPAGLNRSSSYTAHRTSQLELTLEEKEIEGVRAKCIPRKPKTQSSITTKQNINVGTIGIDGCTL